MLGPWENHQPNFKHQDSVQKANRSALATEHFKSKHLQLDMFHDTLSLSGRAYFIEPQMLW